MSSSSQALSAMQKMCGDAVVKGGGVKLTDVNPHLVCVLCHGYFVDATSIVECLHSFCRSCIVLHLDKKSYCPICRENIHNSKALKPDKALQDIVYKLVPGLFHSEMKRRQEFYQKHPHRDMHLHPESRGISVDRLVYTAEELISLSLEYYDKECEQEMWKNVTDGKGLHYIVRTDKPQRSLVRKRYLKCPAAVRMSHLKKFIRLKYNLKPSDFVELLYRRESLSEEYSIMDIAYIYTWNRNEPMRFFYKINACMTVPIMPAPDKCLVVAPQTDVGTAELRRNSQTPVADATTPLPPQVQFMTVATGPTAADVKNKTAAVVQPAAGPSKTPQQSSAAESQPEKPHKTELVLRQDAAAAQRTAVKKDGRPSGQPVPLNSPISPEGTSRKENVSDNVRNCRGTSDASEPTTTAVEEKKPQQTVVEPGAADVPMKRLEKLVDQQTPQPAAVTCASSAAAVAAATTAAVAVTAAVNAPSAASGLRPLAKKTATAVGESKLNLSISKLIMKNQNAAAVAASGGTGKFVPTLQQMQQIGMHTSIPSFQQPPPPSPSPQPNAYVRPGYLGVHPFKRTATDAAPVRSQAPTNRPPFIPVRKSYEWNKARNLQAAKPAAVKDSNKANSEKPTPKKKTAAVDHSPCPPPTVCMPAKNSDEMNAAQSLLRVGHDLRFSTSATTKPQPPPAVPMMADLHDKYNCESSLQITKVTEPETNQPQEKLPSSSQPSLQIMRVPPAVDKSAAAARPTVTVTDTTTAVNGNGGSTSTTGSGKPVNKKPVPSLYSMPTTATTMMTKRAKEQQHHNGLPPPPPSPSLQDNGKRVERRVDTENGVLSVSLLTETSKQDMDAKRREVVQPDVSIKLMTFASAAAESMKKTPELNPIGGGGSAVVNNNNNNNNNKRKQDEPSAVGGVNNKRKQDEPSAVGGVNNKRNQDETSAVGGVNNKRKQDEPSAVGGVNNKRKRDGPSAIGCGGTAGNKRKQEEPERKVTPPRPGTTNCKDDVPQLIEINSSPYAKLLPAKKHQPSKLQAPAAANVLDLSKSPPNSGGGGVTKHQRFGTADGRFSPAAGKPTAGGNSSSPVQYDPSTMVAATSAAINSNLLFAAQRQAAAFLLKQHFDTLNNGLMRNGGTGKGPAEWPRAMFNPALFARPPSTNLNN